MFTTIWKKYLPVIVLLMKRSDKGEQLLEMNYTDFEKAAGGKRIRLSFPGVRLENGRIQPTEKLSLLATDLLMAIQDDEKARWIIHGQLFEFSMSSNFQLSIKNLGPSDIKQI